MDLSQASLETLLRQYPVPGLKQCNGRIFPALGSVLSIAMHSTPYTSFVSASCSMLRTLSAGGRRLGE